MAKTKRPSNFRRTTPHRVVLELDNLVKDIDYCDLENISFEPEDNSFQFKNGRWIAVHQDFPIDNDYDLDILIVVTGNPGTSPSLKVTIDDNEPVTHPSNVPVKWNGRTYFNYEIPVVNV